MRKLQIQCSCELTRSEYLSLLYEAKRRNQERTYFLIKAMCGMGIRIGELPQFTVELLHNGGGVLRSKGTERRMIVPDTLKQEFTDYVERNAILSGPIFVTKNGRTLNRTNICKSIKDLAKETSIPEEKCTPSNLWKLHKKTKQEIEEKFSILSRQAYEQVLLEEQMVNVWNREKKTKEKTILFAWEKIALLLKKSKKRIYME